MSSSNPTFEARLEALKTVSVLATLPGIQHGVERETLRIDEDGKLAQTPHPEALGSALTHDSITTDFSESLLEFITPPESNPEHTMAQLRDIHKFVVQNIGNERLWPMSMPCYIDSQDSIPIASYGESNIGKMKTLYRVGLKNRYGSMMQAIAGVHFNFSLPQDFWQQWLHSVEGEPCNKDTVSSAYFGMIRNYRRLCWLIPYLFGASPAICGSFIKGKETAQPFEKLGKGTYYLPYATSLRMSDLGYTNSAQSGLYICYNQMDAYISSLRRAISSPSEQYQKFAGKVNGEYQQLNANFLQIENELYSPIRPKQPTRSLEKPTDALADRGVEYIEVRALDLNPYSDVGIDLEQFYFLDVFLLYCLVKPSDKLDAPAYQQTEDNLVATVTRGRDPHLTLKDGERLIGLKDWALEMVEQMQDVAAVLDQANQTDKFSLALEAQKQKIIDPDLTPSAKILRHLLDNNLDNGAYGLQLAEQYRQTILQRPYQRFTRESFEQEATASLEAQRQKERDDHQSFDDFLRDYFADSQAGNEKQSLA